MREVYAKSSVVGFQTNKVDSIAVSGNGKNLFVGTTEGALCRYDCQYSGSGPAPSSSWSVECSFMDYMRRSPRDKKPISDVKFVGAWNAVLAISDGFIVIYDSDNYTALGQINESKGCTAFSVHERSSLLCATSKKKVTLFLWQGFGFTVRYEIPVAETPRLTMCREGMVFLGNKKTYEVIEINSRIVTKAIDIDREHKMVAMEVPGTSRRPKSVLVSTGPNSGTLLFAKPGKAGVEVTQDESGRLEWSSPVVSLHLQMPFLVSFLTDAVEIHDIATLTCLQRLAIPGALSISTSSFSGGRTRNRGFGLFVSTADQIVHYSMITLPQQIQSLMAINAFEEALNLCSLCATVKVDGASETDQQWFVDESAVMQIHQRYAMSLHQKGDFEGAIIQHIAGDSNPASVIAMFPELIPHALISAIPGGSTSNLGLPSVTASTVVLPRLTGNILHRAASALVMFCEHHRAAVSNAANTAIDQRSTTSASVLLQLPDHSGSKDGSCSDPDERVRVSVLLDTVLLASNMGCNPPRKQAVIDLVSSPRNRCHIESCSVILASHGNAFIEPLLGLYRSHGEHRRVFAALTEERCGGVGAWTREQFYAWSADYLRWLWQQPDHSLTSLVLQYVKPVFEFDAELGISVFTNSKVGKLSSSASTDEALGSIGGAGLSFTDVLNLFKSIPSDTLANTAKSQPKPLSGSKKSARSPAVIAGNLCTWLVTTPQVPLIDGDALGITYLEWLVCSMPTGQPNSIPIHDEYAKLLMEKIPKLSTVNHLSNDFTSNAQDNEDIKLYKILRCKLQTFLQTSQDYRAERLIQYLHPQFLHEYALLLSRMKCHEEVLQVYIHFLKDVPLAERYCGRLYAELKAQEALMWTSGAAGIGGSIKSDDSYSGSKNGSSSQGAIRSIDIYLSLLKILLCPPPAMPAIRAPNAGDAGSGFRLVPAVVATVPSTVDPERLRVVIDAAERHYDKIDPCAFLDLLPKSVPVASIVNFVSLSLETTTAKQHNQQLLRMREVNIRTAAL